MNSAINLSGYTRQKAHDVFMWIFEKEVTAIAFVFFTIFYAVYSALTGIFYFIVGAFILYI